MKQKPIQLPGMIAISYDDHDNVFVQFVPDEPYTIELDSYLLSGSAQLLRSGQFEFVSETSKQLKLNDYEELSRNESSVQGRKDSREQ